MQLTRPRFNGSRRATLGMLSAVVLMGAAPASALDLGLEEATNGYIFQFFSDVDDIRVYSNLFDSRLQLENQTWMDLHVNRQTVVIPAVDAPAGSPEAIDAITTASRPIGDIGDAFEDYTRTRHEFSADVGRPHLSGGYYVSTEPDYFAQMVRANVDRDFRGQTFNLSVGASYGFDEITPLQDADTQQIDDFRNTTYVNVVATHIATPSTVLRLGLESFWVDGLQHNPYRNVWVAGSNVPEQHPDSRARRDLYVKINQFLPNQASLRLAYKYYTDDWGVRSHTLGGRLSQYVTDNLVVRYRYRFYSQSGSDFYRDEYTDVGGVNGYQTGDFRMGDFTAHLFGTRLSWALRDLLSESGLWSRLKLQLSYERYFNSNNFSANIFETGLALDL